MRLAGPAQAGQIRARVPAVRRPAVETKDNDEDFEARIGFAADAVQRDVLWRGGSRLILNCTRQWGKSTVTAAKAVHMAYFRERSLTVVISPSARQSGEFVRKAAGFVRRLGIRPRGDGDNEISLLLPNGSRIVGLPGKEGTVRGIFGGIAAVDRRSSAGERRPISRGDADAGGDEWRSVADEYAVRQAGILS